MLLELFAAAAIADATPPSAVNPPRWLEKPTGIDFARVYPERAQHAGISGEAELDCRVGIDGYFERCRVFAEAPVGAGFGAAALALAPRFRAPPPDQTATDKALTVRIPIRFRLNGGQPPTRLFLDAPQWASAPTFSDMVRVYPATAMAGAADVTLRCPVEADGAPGPCETIGERPPGQGFADAARALAPRFRLDLDGRTRLDRDFSVDIKVHFIDPRSDDFVNRRIGQPTWIDLPDPAEAATLFPAAAAAKGLKAGRGVVACVVAADGRLKDCAHMAADPAGLGFSEAAAKIASGMRMNPWTDAGGPVDGARVEVPIRLALPAGKP